jgi:hypothetical protein
MCADEATPQSFIKTLASRSLPANYHNLESEQQQTARMRAAFAGQAGWYAEEFGSWLASMMRTDGVMADFRGLLRRFDDCPPEYSRSTIARGEELVRRPYLALIANITPADVRPVAKKGTQLWGDGFLARFAFITPPEKELLTGRFPRGRLVIPQDIARPLLDWHQRLGLPEVCIKEETDKDGELTGGPTLTIKYPSPQECELSEDVYEALYAYDLALMDVVRQGSQTDLDGNYGRLAEKALRVSALLASLEGNGRIEMRHWARAQAITERWRIYTHRLYEQVTRLHKTPQADIEDKILDVLRRWQGTEKYPQGMTATEIARFIHGLGRAQVKRCADELVGLVLEKRKVGRAERYYIADVET